MANEVENSFDELLAEQRHRELMQAVKKLSGALSSYSSGDPELKKLIANTGSAIASFVDKINDLKITHTNEIKVDSHPTEVVASINKLTDVLEKRNNDVDKRLTELEKRPMPTKLRAVRDSYQGTIDYVIVEYKK